MRELEGLSYRQIGEQLGMSRPSVESTLFRARRRLSEEYEELVSGERCRRIQAIIAGATGGRAGTRDERKMARHVSYCQPCRRAAFAAGFDADALTPKRTVREKIAALLPLPAFLKRRIAGRGGEESAATSAGGHAATLAQLSTAAAAYADPAMHWGKAVAKAAAVAAAVVGAGVAAHDTGLIGGTPRDERPAAISSPATPSRDAADSLTTRPAANGTSLGTGSTGGSTSSSNPSSGTPSSGSGSGSSGGSSSPSTPLGDDPAKAATSQLPSGATDNPLTKTVKHLTQPGSGGVPVKTPEVPRVEVPKVELPKLPDPPASVPDPGGVVSGATGTVNDATGAVTGAANDATGAAGGAVNDATGTVGGAVDATGGAVTGTVGGVTGGGGILGGG
jgi:hypothetical protein